MDSNVQRNSYDHRKPDSAEIICNYCRKPSHMKHDCWKLLYKNSQRSQHAQIASTCDIPEASGTISIDEFAKIQNYQDSLQASSSSTPVASTVAPDTTKFLLTSCTKWVIDSSATTHMRGNSNLFSRTLSPAPFPSVTLADGPTSSVLGSGAIYLTPSFLSSFVLHLPNLSFNLISTSQLTHLIYPEFPSLSSLNCDLCQFAKFHRLSSSPRVNKRASAPFELVHSDIWGLCPVISQTGFRYFVTFVDDHSRLTWLYLMKKWKNCSELLSHFYAFHTEIKKSV